MNWHLFIDFAAWMCGIILTFCGFIFCGAILTGMKPRKDDIILAGKTIILASLCWAWIIAS